MASIIEELSEEDQQLKSELDMLVERLQVWGLEMYVCVAAASHMFSFRSRILLCTSPPLRPLKTSLRHPHRR